MLKKMLILIFVTALFFPATMLEAQIKGNGLLVAPTRLVFEGNTRALELTLSNNGNETSTFRIETKNTIMTENGERIEAVKGDSVHHLFADKLIRFAPRQVRLKPGEQQTIRIMARVPGNLAKGEYRTNLSIRTLPEAEVSGADEDKDQGKDKISIMINFALGITIPVIIRHGALEAVGNISGLDLSDTEAGKKLTVTISREGNRSLYGDLSVFRIKKDGKEELISSVRGIAVYVPNPRRLFTINFPVESINSAVSNREKLRVEYREPLKDGGKIISEAFLETGKQ